MKVLTGVPASPGTGSAPAFIHRAGALELPEERVDDPDEAITRLSDAMEEVAAELEAKAQRAEGELAEILEAQAMMARDPELASTATAAVGERRTHPARAVVEAGEEYATVLAASESEYMAARAEDIRDVCRRIARELLGAPPSEIAEIDEPSVVAALELPPADVAELKPGSVVGIVTERGSRTSHTAIVARALRIPAVVGVEGLLDALEEGSQLALDGDDGNVFVDPDEDTRRRAESRAAERERRRSELEARARDEPLHTKDGHRVELAANVGAAVELDAALDEGAEAVGLLRTELVYLDRAEPPGEDEQVEMLEAMTAGLGDRRLVVRTFDFGADKPVPFLAVEPEENPALGVRGIRLARKHQDLLDDQVRAVVRAAGAGGRLGIMAPMVGTLEEAEWFAERVRAAAARDLLGDRAEGSDRLGDRTEKVEVGVMVEVPSAVFITDRLAELLDFVSIGTNDLTQYLHAADRQSGSLAYLQDAFSPALLRAVQQVGDACRGKAWVGVCGEAAGDPAWALVAVGLGVTELSMGADRLLEVRVAIQDATLEDCRAAARAALDASDAAGARRAAEGFLPASVRSVPQ